MRPDKIHCFFEQSNTFRDVARSMGYEADSYDIEGNPSHKVDLFEQIRLGNRSTLLNEIKRGDLILAFFPCTYFEAQSEMCTRCDSYAVRDWSLAKKIEYSSARERERSDFYQTFCQMVSWTIGKGVRLIVENPYSTQSYLIKYFPMKPQLVITDRTEYGDTFRKPTAFWFLNCEPNMFVPKTKGNKGYNRISETSHGIERSLITKEFAERFLEGFVGLERK